MALAAVWNGAPVLYRGAPMSAGILNVASFPNFQAVSMAYNGSKKEGNGKRAATNLHPDKSFSLTGTRMERPITWGSWKNARMALSIRWKEILVMPVGNSAMMLEMQ